MTSIGQYAFRDCSSLTSVTIPNSMTSIGERAFYGCTGLTSITIPNSVTSIGEGAFRDCCSLTSVTIPNSVTSIGQLAFAGCSGLKSITIPNSMTSIGERAFMNCSSLTSVTIPNSVTNIDKEAFIACWKLTEIKLKVKTDKKMVTYRAPYDIDFTTPVSGVTAYVVTEVKDGKATLQKVTSKVKAGTGLILKGTAGETYDLTGDIPQEGVTPEANMLVGVLADTEIGGNNVDYILQDGKFVKATAGTLKAGKAYLKLDAALAREVIEIDGEVTGISSVNGEGFMVNGYYNLNGQRISQPTKGLYIKNGKKQIVK